jgi:hypothetical protein
MSRPIFLNSTTFLTFCAKKNYQSPSVDVQLFHCGGLWLFSFFYRPFIRSETEGILSLGIDTEKFSSLGISSMNGWFSSSSMTMFKASG